MTSDPSSGGCGRKLGVYHLGRLNRLGASAWEQLHAIFGVKIMLQKILAVDNLIFPFMFME